MSIYKPSVFLAFAVVFVLLCAVPSSGLSYVSRSYIPEPGLSYVPAGHDPHPVSYASPRTFSGIRVTDIEPPLPLGWSEFVHNSHPTTYTDWSYESAEPTSGLIWGLQCKGVACTTKTPFIMSPISCLPPLNVTNTVDTVATNMVSSGTVFCPHGSFVSNVLCTNPGCTALKLQCAPIIGIYRPVYKGIRNQGFFHITDYKRIYCNGGEYMDGVKCSGSCTDNFNIHCTKVIKLDI